MYSCAFLYFSDLDEFPSSSCLWDILRLPLWCLWLVSSFLRIIAMGNESLLHQHPQNQCPACSVALDAGEYMPYWKKSVVCIVLMTSQLWKCAVH